MDRARLLAAMAVGLSVLLLMAVGLAAFVLQPGVSSEPVLPEVTNPPVVAVAATRPSAPVPAALPPSPPAAAETAKADLAEQEAAPPAPPQLPAPAAPEAKPKPPEPKLPAPAPAPAPLTPEQKRINAAIDRGVKFLKTSQYNNGRWDVGAWPVGYAALPGLTLLECGVPASNSAVQRAAKFVRSRASTLTATYELSLTILFLDRLGEPRDRDLIQTLAMRLIAGQNGAGGWTYHCPVLAKADHQRLMAFLLRQEKQPLLDPVRSPVADNSDPLGKSVGTSSDDLLRATAPGDSSTADLVQPVDPGAAPAPEKKKKGPTKSTKNEPLPAHLKGLPVVRMNEEAAKPSGNKPGPKARGLRGGVSGDNSNTQFATLALWVARRHGVPMERTLTLIDHRFQTSQNADGGWGYHSDGAAASSKASMTCVGLLGLAVGRGFARETATLKGAGEPPVPPPGQPDPAIPRGLKKLGEYLDAPERFRLAGVTIDLYTLWSIERVGVLYNLKTIGNKDWYPWAGRLLVANQNANGSWWGRGYHGSSPTIDTCLALLILKRTNLVQDLSDSLPRIGISEPDTTSRMTSGP